MYVKGRVFRVTFASANGPGVAVGTAPLGSEEALAAASQALAEHKAALAPLFEHVEREQAARKR